MAWTHWLCQVCAHVCNTHIPADHIVFKRVCVCVHRIPKRMRMMADFDDLYDRVYGVVILCAE